MALALLGGMALRRGARRKSGGYAAARNEASASQPEIQPATISSYNV